MRTILLIALVLVVGACGEGPSGAEPANLSGPWRLTESDAIGWTESTSVLITQTGAAFAGATGDWTCTLPDGQRWSCGYAGAREILNGRIAGDQVRFDMTAYISGMRYLIPYVGRLSAGKITGTWEADLNFGTPTHYPFTMERQ